MTTHQTVFDNDFKIDESDKKFNYQKELTSKLDDEVAPFDQNIINEIVLWKVDRYAQIDNVTLNLINEIDKRSAELDIELTKKILKSLLLTKGIQLPMASTILRFKNKNIYQIIDQRVYRIIYKNKKLKLKTHPSDKNLDTQIEIYFQYLKDLKDVCQKLEIPFNQSDRILFKADKRVNKGVKLDHYGFTERS